MSGRRYPAAVIGVGKAGGGGPKGGGHAIAYSHAGALKRSPRVDLRAGCDINTENLAAFRQKFDVPQGFEDYRAMLRELKPDLVSIATYVGLHRPMIEAAADAGVKGIICEKPFVNSPADLDAVRRIVERTGVKIVIAHVRRYGAAFVRARELYNNGTVGKPVMVFAGIDGWDLSEWGSHWLDMIRYFHEDRPVAWVMGQARVGNFRGYGHLMEDHAVAYFGFEGGGRGVVDGGTAIGENSLTLVGTTGVIRVNQESRLVIENTDGRREETFDDDPVDGWKALGLPPANGNWAKIWDVVVADLVAWIEGGPVPRIGLPHTFASAELNLATYVSALRGDRVDLPLQGDDLKIDRWPVEVIGDRNAKAKGGA